mgnify:CR=1 FL=1
MTIFKKNNEKKTTQKTTQKKKTNYSKTTTPTVEVKEKVLPDSTTVPLSFDVVRLRFFCLDESFFVYIFDTV